MPSFQFSRRTVLTSAGVAALALAGCSDADPLGTADPGQDPDTTDDASEPAAGGPIRVGSAGFTENEIIAEVYAQALEEAGYTVERNMQIGARDIYYGALTDGSVDIVPEYSGNLLQFLDPEATAAEPDAIISALEEAVPEGLRVLDPAKAENKDSWCVTSEFSETNGITSLADLAGFEGTLRVAGNPELAERPYGPPGLTEIYGVPAESIEFTPIDDGGGPLTVQALVAGDVDMADIYTTTPAISDEGLVVLEDPENMIIAQNVVPLASDAFPVDAEGIIDAVNIALTTEDLIAMNARNQGDEKASPATIATDWLTEKGLLGG
ncbi:ABC transporter substrate-binding protein [Tessaracoccus rhinocerotis]|uniref:ABC transporter substrate-binding protein n=1 Tax=Tessaracoccus rhinocerotis TaxID=1689449 RepID=A0A553JX52_9ACTN|nr:ABC transporter substrate-binding protein [Tessaracoccus rhinocerotis]TRY17038.1 ABC transporter substrate-binding protein [Tessaracoccus rhinocerotis]